MMATENEALSPATVAWDAGDAEGGAEVGLPTDAPAD